MKKNKNLILLFLSGAILLLGFSSYAAELNSYGKGLQAELAGDYQTAIVHYTKSANEGLSDAGFALGRTYRTLGDHSASMKWFLRAATAGNQFAQYEVGLIYLNGSLQVAPPQLWTRGSTLWNSPGPSPFEPDKALTMYPD